MEPEITGRKRVNEFPPQYHKNILYMEEELSKMKSFAKKFIDYFSKDVETDLRRVSAIVPMLVNEVSEIKEKVVSIMLTAQGNS